MTVQALYLGGADTPLLFKVGSTYKDDGAIYELLAESRPIAPNGAGGECLFTYVHLTTRHYADDVSFWLSALVDDRTVARQRLDLIGVSADDAPQGVTQSRAFALSVPYVRGGVERTRTAPRGTWFRLRIETRYGDAEPGAALAAAQQIMETAELEFQPVRRHAAAPRVTA